MTSRTSHRLGPTGSQVSERVLIEIGGVSVDYPYRLGDTVGHLRPWLARQSGHNGNEQVTYHGGVPGDTKQVLDDSRPLDEFINRGGRLRVERSTLSPNQAVSMSNNHIGTAMASGNSTVGAGDRMSDQAVLGYRGQPLPTSNNTIGNAYGWENGEVRAGQVFGSDPQQRGQHQPQEFPQPPYGYSHQPPTQPDGYYQPR